MTTPYVPPASRLKMLLTRKLRLAQLSLRPDAAEAAVDYIMQYLSELYDSGNFIEDTMHYVDKQFDVLTDVLLAITKDDNDRTTIDSPTIKKAIQILLVQDHTERTSVDQVANAIQTASMNQIQHVYITDPYCQPFFRYAIGTNTYYLDDKPRPLHADSAASISLYYDRFYFIFRRILQQYQRKQQLINNNRQSTMNSAAENEYLSILYDSKIVDVDSLSGSHGPLTAFGYLSYHLGKLYIESPHSKVQVDLSCCSLVDISAITDDYQQQQQQQTQQQQQKDTIVVSYSQTPAKKSKNNNQNLLSQTTATPLKGLPTHKSPLKKPLSSVSTTTTSSSSSSSSVISSHSIFARLFCPGSFLLIHGEIHHNIFYARWCQLPCHEPRSQTLNTYPILGVIPPNTDLISYPQQHSTTNPGLVTQLNMLQPTASPQHPLVPLVNPIAAQESPEKSSLKQVDTITFLKNEQILSDALQNKTTLSSPTSHHNDRILILGELYLHDHVTMSKLGLLFRSLSSCPPQYIIFTGNYFSPQFYTQNRSQPHQFRQMFDHLADVILSQGGPQLCSNTHFVFANGTFDIMFGDVLPPPPISQCFTQRLTKTLSNVTFCSNPLQMRYMGREIRVFRGDIYQSIYARDSSFLSTGSDSWNPYKQIEKPEATEKGKKVTSTHDLFSLDDDDDGDNDNDNDDDIIIPPLNTAKMTDKNSAIIHQSSRFNVIEADTFENMSQSITDPAYIGEIVVKHMLSQSTLLPTYTNTLWRYSQAYDLLTLPDVVFLLDQCDPYYLSRYSCQFQHIGPFTGKWTIAFYFPASNEIQISQVE